MYFLNLGVKELNVSVYEAIRGCVGVEDYKNVYIVPGLVARTETKRSHKTRLTGRLVLLYCG